MYNADWLIDFVFDYPVDCTPVLLRERLEYLAADWPGWENFPWRVTRSIHKFLDHPPVNFPYLMLHRCLQGYAAHLVLTSRFESRPDVLAVLIREKCEIVGLLRLLLIDAVRYELRFTKQDRMPDCSGPGEGHEEVLLEELAKRRAAFRECIEGAVKEFVRILDLMSVAENMNARIYGRPLRYWARGGDMPEAVTLPVQVEVTAAGKVLRPCQAERSIYVRTGFTRAEVMVERRVVVCRLKAVGGKVSSEQSAVNSGETGKKAGDRSQNSEGGMGSRRGAEVQRVDREGGETGNVQHPTSNVQLPGGDVVGKESGDRSQNSEGGMGSRRGAEAQRVDREGGETGNVQHSTSNVQLPGGDGERAKARKVVAGFGRAAVRNRGDRKDIRVEVQRLMKMGIPQTEACQQVADQAKNGRAGQRRLTMKYDLSPNLATGSVVRRVLFSDW